MILQALMNRKKVGALTLIKLVVMGGIILSVALGLYLILNQPISVLAPSEDLREYPEAIYKLKEIVDTYKQNRQKRLEERDTTDIFRQEDFEIFNAFIMEYSDTDTALTARLIVAEQLIEWAIIPDMKLHKKIYKEITHNYSDRWQGEIAKTGLLATEIFEVDSNFDDPENRIAMANEMEKLLEIATYLDNSTRPDIQAYCSLRKFPIVYGILNSIARRDEILGEYEAAKECYKRIIELYTGTKMELRTKSLLKEVQTKLEEKKQDKNPTN